MFHLPVFSQISHFDSAAVIASVWSLATDSWEKKQKNKQPNHQQPFIYLSIFFLPSVIATHVLCSQHRPFFHLQKQLLFSSFFFCRYKSISEPLRISPQVAQTLPKQNFLNFQNMTTAIVFARSLPKLQNPFRGNTCSVARIHTIPATFWYPHVRWWRSYNSL